MSTLLNMVRQNVTSVAGSGLGALTLAGAQTGYKTAVQAGAVDGKVYSYVILEVAKFEMGYGVFSSSGTVFTRSRVVSSSNANTFDTFTSSATFQITALADDFNRMEVAAWFDT